jgi:RND family efflux transporter MFP subunit
MNYRAGLLTGILVTAAVAALVALGWSALGLSRKKDEPAKTKPPATVLKEEDLLVITLTDDAEKRLGIQTAKVEQKPVPRTRTFGGDVTTPPGHTILVSAPLNGTLKAPNGGIPRAGARVKKGDPIFQLLPLLSPDARTTFAAARVDAEGQVNNARVQLAAAKVNLDRAKELVRTEGASQRMLDDSQAQFDLAQKTLDAAQARLALLNQAVGDADKGTASPLTIEAPTDGLLRNVSALAEQNVPSGAALFEVVNLDPVWVRVPVFVGEADDLRADSAEVGPLTVRPGVSTQPARAVSAPPSANPLAGTVDLFFTLSNTGEKFRPGERVGVTIALKDPADSLTIPWSAVVHDIHGGTWVYEKTGDHTYVRRRVQIHHVVNDTAVLKSGPAKSKTVVSVGAQELFGTEVGFSK